MECNQSIIGIAKSNQFARISEDQQISSHVRLYTCSFCKRGFSNAQALGGHMNVHRRDRAKLKQALACEDHSLLSLTIMTDKTPLHVSSSPDDESSSSSCNPKARPSPTTEEEVEQDDDSNRSTGKDQMKQLLLFEETSFVTNTKQLSNNHSADSGLDLELRLGL